MTLDAIEAPDVRAAWASAIQLLVERAPRYSLVVSIEDPCVVPEQDLRVLDPQRFDGDAKALLDVAATIFPRRRAQDQRHAREFLDAKINAYTRWQERSPGTWGTYFSRLVRFGEAEVDQLMRCIDALNGWARRQRGALVVHLSSPEYDRPRAQGQPCWHYGEFLREDEATLSLLAVYRSHDYFLKALGNFIGLARLLKFVADSTGMKCGRLVCVSCYATLGCSKKVANEMLKEANA
jgi:hypothetical protein